MHIMEGFLPLYWCAFWYVVSLPFVAYGFYKLNRIVKERRDTLPLLAVSGAFIFVLSSLKLPSVTGSCSHPTGTGMSAILFGPFVTSVLGLIVLVYQALFLAHGGLTTLGANVFSMAIAGPIVGYWIYRGGNAVGLNTFVTVFLAAAIADLFTYVVTSLQLALAFPAEIGGIMASFAAFGAVFAFTQVPLAIIEGLVIALTFKYIIQVRSDILVSLKVLTPTQVKTIQESFA
ncbi:energy-coupling factor ABC transporter permease [bacterium]|nr:MAG: energy-coupling factor ABC transporter permease [bacterium]